MARATPPPLPHHVADSNIGAIQSSSFKPDANLDEDNEDVHGNGRLQGDFSECLCLCNKHELFQTFSYDQLFE